MGLAASNIIARFWSPEINSHHTRKSKSRSVEEILMMARVVKGPFPLYQQHTEAATPQTNSDLANAFRLLDQWTATDNKAREFQSIIPNLPLDDLKILAGYLARQCDEVMIRCLEVYEALRFDSAVTNSATDTYSHRLEYAREFRSRRVEEILKMAHVLKGPFPLNQQTEAAMAEANSNLADAFLVYYQWSATDSKALEFQSIVRKLPLNELEILADRLRGEYYMNLAREIDGKFLSGGPVVIGQQKSKDPGFVIKAAIHAIGGATADVVVGKVFSFFETPASSEPGLKAAITFGVLLLTAGMFLQVKRPGLAKFMVKLGFVAIVSCILVPMAFSLPPVMGWVFGAITEVIVVFTAAFC